MSYLSITTHLYSRLAYADECSHVCPFFVVGILVLAEGGLQLSSGGGTEVNPRPPLSLGRGFPLTHACQVKRPDCRKQIS